MIPSDQLWALQLLILEDERLLETLREREVELLQRHGLQSPQATTRRKALLSEARVVIDRLERNRLHLSDLT